MFKQPALPPALILPAHALLVFLFVNQPLPHAISVASCILSRVLPWMSFSSPLRLQYCLRDPPGVILPASFSSPLLDFGSSACLPLWADGSTPCGPVPVLGP